MIFFLPIILFNLSCQVTRVKRKGAVEVLAVLVKVVLSCVIMCLE